MGYLEGIIKDLSTHIKSANTTNSETTSTTTTKLKNYTINTISWDSNEPPTSKWIVRNTWSKGLLLCNIQNPIRLGVDVSSTVVKL